MRIIIVSVVWYKDITKRRLQVLLLARRRKQTRETESGKRT